MDFLSPVISKTLNRLEAWSTGRSSNEGCEAWVATSEGGFRMKGAPTPVKLASKIEEAPVEELSLTDEKPRRAAKRGNRRRSRSRSARDQDAPAQQQQSEDGAQEPSGEREGRKDEQATVGSEDADQPAETLPEVQARAASEAAEVMSTSLNLTPASKRLVAAAARAGAAAAYLVGEDADRENVPPGGKKLSKKADKERKKKEKKEKEKEKRAAKALEEFRKERQRGTPRPAEVVV